LKPTLAVHAAAVLAALAALLAALARLLLAALVLLTGLVLSALLLLAGLTLAALLGVSLLLLVARIVLLIRHVDVLRQVLEAPRPTKDNSPSVARFLPTMLELSTTACKITRKLGSKDPKGNRSAVPNAPSCKAGLALCRARSAC
jgi:hypothetical protein